MRVRWTRVDVSLGLGWAALAASGLGVLLWIYSIVVDHAGNTFPDPTSWAAAQLSLVVGGILAVVAVLAAVVRRPSSVVRRPVGRGLGPAKLALLITLSALGLLFLAVGGGK